MQIKNTKNKGRGVFATENYLPNDIIEICPVIVLNSEDRKIIDKTFLYNYYFSWGKKSDKAAIVLGFGSLYNHSYSPNAKYIKDSKKRCLQIIAIKTISNGDEVKINYNGDPTNNDPLWFEVK